MSVFNDEELRTFRNVVASRLGLHFDETQNGLLADTLRERLQVRGTSPTRAYLALLANDREELRALACRVTVAETYFFRVWDQFRVLVNTALPARIRARRGGSKLRILSAGCASGEEPYSVAIILREHFPELEVRDIEILGVDINHSALAKARRGRYHAWSLRDTPAELRERYFRLNGSEYVLDETIRAMVAFEEQNLATGTLGLSNIRRFDIVLCRNVMMYLVPEAAQTLIAGLTKSLEPNGFLFLGSAETLRGLSHDFHLRHTDGSFYYEKREEAIMDAAAFPGTQMPAEFAECLESDWAGTIQKASERIEELSRTPNGVAPAYAIDGPAATGAPGPARPSQHLGSAFEFVRQERFREALELMQGLPPEDSRDPDAQLLRAGLLVNCSDLSSAEAVCRDILDSDELNAGAHYLMALCREYAGDASGAVEHDRAAIYLDSSFAMPHLHLGRLARRSADFAAARRELADAHVLLLREDPSRIFLFGGGFSREALIALSRAELRACGGSP